MIARPLAFRRDYHWRELSPAEGASRWRFEYLMEVPHRLHTDLGACVQLCDKDGKPWVVIDGRWWLTQPGYKWNGCSPKRHIRPFGWLGTPDVIGGSNGVCGNLIGSGWHDQACQFQKTEFVAKHFTGRDIDHGFRELLEQSYFVYAGVFHKAVAVARPLWPHRDEGQHSRIIDP